MGAQYCSVAMGEVAAKTKERKRRALLYGTGLKRVRRRLRPLPAPKLGRGSGNRLPHWAPKDYRPDTSQYVAAANRIANINFGAWRKAREEEIKQERAWKHHVDVSRQPRSMWSRRQQRAARGHLIKMDPDSALYKTLTKDEASWLEGLEEDALARQFEESIQDDPKDIQDLKRKMRNMQGDWEKRLKKEYGEVVAMARKQVAVKHRPYLKDARGSKADPTTNLPRMKRWLQRHGHGRLKARVDDEKLEARGENWTASCGNAVFTTRPPGWFKGMHSGEKTEMRAAPRLRIRHSQKWVPASGWNRKSRSTQSLPPLASAIVVSGGSFCSQ